MCGETKQASEFHANRSKKLRLSDECKACISARNAKTENKERRRASRQAMTPEQRAKHRDRYRRLVRTPSGAATYAWYRLTHRVKAHSNYAGVEVRMTRGEFLAW